MRLPTLQRGSFRLLVVTWFLVYPFGVVSPSKAVSPFGGRGAFHDFHTSLTQMQVNPKTKVVEVSIRAFTDDLELALTRENGGKPVRLAGPAKPDALLERYVRRHFLLADNQRKPLPYTYLGYEPEADAQWVYLEMPAPGPALFKNSVMKQDILMEVFGDQVNLVTIQIDQQKKTFVFRNNQPVQAVSF